MSETEVKPIIITVGVDARIMQLLSSTFKGCTVINRECTPELLEVPMEQPIGIILCGDATTDVSIMEIGQSLRMMYANASIFFATFSRQSFKMTDLKKNGFNEAFLLPPDQPTMEVTIRREVSKISDGKIKAFRPVELMDIAPDSVLGFDLYLHLPANDRKIRYVSKVEQLGTERASKLQKHNFKAVHVSEEEMPQFYKFTAQQLKNLGNNKNISETEKKEKREAAVRGLLANIFSTSGESATFESGKNMVDECKEVVKAFVIDQDGKKNSWLEKFMAISNSESTTYSRSVSTATFATLFSIALGIGDPNELAIAALLHDIGLADVPVEICIKPEDKRTQEENEKYYQHPIHSINLIKERRMIVSEKILKIIEQHHERFNGTGWPARLPGPRICPEAQILAIADEIEEMTAVKPGQPRVSVKEAVDVICDRGLGNPANSTIDPVLLRRIKGIFSPAA